MIILRSKSQSKMKMTIVRSLIDTSTKEQSGGLPQQVYIHFFIWREGLVVAFDFPNWFRLSIIHAIFYSSKQIANFHNLEWKYTTLKLAIVMEHRKCWGKSSNCSKVTKKLVPLKLCCSWNYFPKESWS